MNNSLNSKPPMVTGLLEMHGSYLPDNFIMIDYAFELLSQNGDKKFGVKPPNVSLAGHGLNNRGGLRQNYLLPALASQDAHTECQIYIYI